MHYTEREEEVERFRKPLEEGGARFLICTDAAGEGINLQFCWIMINYDVPWNPARLEQRMGRIHRYGQKHDPVIILNLVAPSTREGKVLKMLLDKLEKIRKELQSDKVFDCIGRHLRGCLHQAVHGACGHGGCRRRGARTGRPPDEGADPGPCRAREVPLWLAAATWPKNCRACAPTWSRKSISACLPGYVRQYIEQAAPLVDIEIEGDMDGVFSFRPARFGARWTRFLPALELYPEKCAGRLSVLAPDGPEGCHLASSRRTGL